MTDVASLASAADRITDAISSKVTSSLGSQAYADTTWGMVLGISRDGDDGAYEASVLLVGTTLDDEGASYGWAVVNGIVPTPGDYVRLEYDNDHDARRILEVIAASDYQRLEFYPGEGRISIGDGVTPADTHLSSISGDLAISGGLILPPAGIIKPSSGHLYVQQGDGGYIVFRDSSGNVQGFIDEYGNFHGQTFSYKVYKTSTQAVSNAYNDPYANPPTASILTWDATRWNNYAAAGAADPTMTNSVVYARRVGLWYIHLQVEWAASASGGRVAVVHDSSNALWFADEVSTGAGARPWWQHLGGLWYATDSTDWLRVRVYQNSGATLNVAATHTWLTAIWLGDYS